MTRVTTAGPVLGYVARLATQRGAMPNQAPLAELSTASIAVGIAVATFRHATRRTALALINQTNFLSR